MNPKRILLLLTSILVVFSFTFIDCARQIDKKEEKKAKKIEKKPILLEGTWQGCIDEEGKFELEINGSITCESNLSILFELSNPNKENKVTISTIECSYYKFSTVFEIDESITATLDNDKIKFLIKKGSIKGMDEDFETELAITKYGKETEKGKPAKTIVGKFEEKPMKEIDDSKGKYFKEKDGHETVYYNETLAHMVTALDGNQNPDWGAFYVECLTEDKKTADNVIQYTYNFVATPKVTHDSCGNAPALVVWLSDGAIARIHGIAILELDKIKEIEISFPEHNKLGGSHGTHTVGASKSGKETLSCHLQEFDNNKKEIKGYVTLSYKNFETE